MKRSTRIIFALAVTIVLGAKFAYQDAEEKDLAFRSHPVVAVATDFFCGFLAAAIFYFGSGWFAKRKERKSNFNDDEFYDRVANELKANTQSPGLWTKAYSEMNGDEAKAKALYIRYRVQQLKTESQVQAERANDRGQSDHAHHQAEEKRKKSMARRLAWEALPPLSPIHKIGALSLGVICLSITGLCVLSTIGFNVSGEPSQPNGDRIFQSLLFVGVATLFGWLAFKCFKNAKR